MLPELVLRPAGDDRAQVRPGREVEHALEAHLRADVRAQLVDRVVDVLELTLEARHVLLGLMVDEPDEQRLLVGEVVVDGGAPDLGRLGDLRERDRVEAAVVHEGGKGGEQLVAGLFAVLSERATDDLGHGDILPPLCHHVRHPGCGGPHPRTGIHSVNTWRRVIHRSAPQGCAPREISRVPPVDRAVGCAHPK